MEKVSDSEKGPDSATGRIYRTGDLARLRADGSFEFLGRRDFQVKIRGFRIELGDVEAALMQHPMVEKAVVIGRTDDQGDQQLVAYVKPAEDMAEEDTAEKANGTSHETDLLTAASLRRFIVKRLPDYMIPSAFAILDAFPLTPNGKIDRLSLPAPDSTQRCIDDAVVLPQTPTESSLVDIWRNLLGTDEVGVDDNFFELGGHSILATRVVSQIRDRFSVELPLRKIFEASTIAELALTIDQLSASETKSQSAPVTISRQGRQRFKRSSLS